MNWSNLYCVKRIDTQTEKYDYFISFIFANKLSRCAVSSINLFGAYLRSTRQGHLLDVQADRILSALLRRVGADRSIKFLYNESFDALCSITRALSPTVVVNLLCLQVSEQKAKSAKTRIVVGNILRQRMEIITHSVEDMEEFSRQFSAEGMERLIKVAAILTEDRLSETRLEMGLFQLFHIARCFSLKTK